MKANPVKSALAAGKPQIGTWLSLGSVAAARFLARTGLPWLTVDVEHTHTDINTAAMMFGAIADGGCVPLARIPAADHTWIKRMLDCGAYGIVAPMVMDAAEAKRVVKACKYPPEGNRSVGGGFHALNFDAQADEYYARANDEVLAIIQTEHIAAVEIADEIYSVPGIDAVFVGPNDLAASMKTPDGQWPSKERQEEVLQEILAACKRNKVPAGLHVFSIEDALRRAEEGWQFIAVNSELRFMLEGAKQLAQRTGSASAQGIAKY
jgi:4-hydroxy-2-oxoheptanedioate aldolase